MCSGAGLCVIVLNSTLSVSVTVRRIACLKHSPDLEFVQVVAHRHSPACAAALSTANARPRTARGCARRGAYRALDEIGETVLRAEHGESGLRRPAGARHASPKLGRRLARALGVRARTSDGRERELPRKPGREASADAGLLETFDQQEHICGAAARNRGDGVHVPLVVDPSHRAHGREKVRADRALRCATAEFATSTVIPLPIAAGVFGIARTTAAPAPRPASSCASVLPAAIERCTVPRRGVRRTRRAPPRADSASPRSRRRRDAARCGSARSLAATPSCAATARAAGAGSTTRIACGRDTLREPAANQRLAHVPEPDQQDFAVSSHRHSRQTYRAMISINRPSGSWPAIKSAYAFRVRA